MTYIIGKEVMIDEHSSLTPLESDVLLRIGDGETQQVIREAHALSLAQLTQIEMDIRRKLAANTLPHARCSTHQNADTRRQSSKCTNAPSQWRWRQRSRSLIS